MQDTSSSDARVKANTISLPMKTILKKTKSSSNENYSGSKCFIAKSSTVFLMVKVLSTISSLY